LYIHGKALVFGALMFFLILILALSIQEFINEGDRLKLLSLNFYPPLV